MAETKITQQVIEEIKSLIRKKMPDADIRKILRHNSGLGKSRSNELFNKIKSDVIFEDLIVHPTVCQSTPRSVLPPKYFYNDINDEYSVTLSGKEIVVSGKGHREAQEMYCGEREYSAKDVASYLGLTEAQLMAYKSAFGWTRGSLIISDERVLSEPLEDNLDILLGHKKTVLQKTFEARRYSEVEKDAERWQRFSHGTIQKIRDTLDSWTPPKNKNTHKYVAENNGPLTLCVGLNDTHISELFHKDKAFGGEPFNTKIAASRIESYISQIKDTIHVRKQKFGKILIFVNGDYLNSCMDGRTRKGTQLSNDLVNEEMFQAGLDILINFVDELAQIAPVEVFTQKGNHESVLLTYLAIAAEMYFKDIDTVKFNISKAWASLYRVNNVAIILSHGGHDTLDRSHFPSASTPAKLKGYIQDMLLGRRDELVGVKQILIVTGHRHVFSQIDMGSFEFFCFGALPPSGDYENANNWHSTARQNCIILDNDHLVETLHYYFD